MTLQNGGKCPHTAQYHISKHSNLVRFLSTVGTPHNFLSHKLYIQTKSVRRILTEKLPVSQLLSKFLTFYGNRRFITTFTSSHQFSPTLFTHFQFLSLLITSSLPLGLPSGLFPSDFSTNPHTPLFYQSHQSPIVFCKQYKSQSS
jgi:hypothetical protein